MTSVILKPGREKSLLRKHPWIFSGAIDSIPACAPGSIFPVYSATGQFLAKAYFHPNTSLSGRVLTFEDKDVKEEIKNRIKEALSLRKALFTSTTNAYRLINAEADGIPGCIVDNYDGYLVIQIHTQGIENLRPFLIQALLEVVAPKAIYEKSSSSSRQEEGLLPREEEVYGQTPSQITILENGLSFRVSIPEGQKTGFFLDQREMRKKVLELAKDRRVLNCFSYSGGFGVYACKGGARSVLNVDSCPKACLLSIENAKLNGLTQEVLREDVFTYLEESKTLDFDFVILDPPAFAKKKKHLDNALKAYQKLNALTLSKMPKKAFLLTSSCSYHVEENLFQQAIFQAAQLAQRSVRILSRHIQALDHPVGLNHPEGAYLKSFLLFVD